MENVRMTLIDGCEVCCVNELALFFIPSIERARSRIHNPSATSAAWTCTCGDPPRQYDFEQQWFVHASRECGFAASSLQSQWD